MGPRRPRGRRTVELGEAIRSVLAEDAGPLHLVDAQGAIDRLQASRCARPAVGAQARRLLRRGSRSASASREAPGRRRPPRRAQPCSGGGGMAGGGNPARAVPGARAQRS